MKENFLTAVEAAKILKLQPDTIRKHVQRGVLSPVRKIGQAYLFERSEIDRFRCERKQPGRPSRGG